MPAAGEIALAPRHIAQFGGRAPNICYRCHCDKQEMQQIAGPHQICGPNGFNCTTCHDPHGKLKEETRKDLCLTCHQGSPTMAWHSSTHNINGVACTDCHNPHPKADVPQFVNISHETIKRPLRLTMSVQQPEVCYKCHPQIYGKNALPSHHPIKEGKMVCSDCHDAHGQTTDNLREPTINLLCYKCHAEKQGPFAIEHPPVRGNARFATSRTAADQQPAPAAGDVPLPAVPSRPQRTPSAGRHQPASQRRSHDPPAVLHQLRPVPFADSRDGSHFPARRRLLYEIAASG